MDERWVRVIVAAAFWLAVLVVARWLLGRAYRAWERRQVDTDPVVVARRRTTFSFLRRLTIVVIGVIGAWNVLSIFPQTDEVARALLASSAVLALLAGLALSTPLGNLGAGVLISFSQPLRIGDRVTVGEHTGFVEQINAIYTALVTDDEKRVFVPNMQLVSAAIVNRTIRDPRRVVSVDLPVRLGAPIDAARATVMLAIDSVAGLHHGRAKVLVGNVDGNLVWLTAIASAPLDANVTQLGSDVREAALAALAEDGHLPG